MCVGKCEVNNKLFKESRLIFSKVISLRLIDNFNGKKEAERKTTENLFANANNIIQTTHTY